MQQPPPPPQQQDPSRPATGYPYPYPYPNPQPTNGYPPPPYQNHNPYYAQPQPNPRAVLLRRLFIAFTAFFVIFGLILFIFILIARPQLPEVSVSSLSVSNFNVSDSKVSGKWDLELKIRNPNSKMSLNYDSLFCSLNYGHESLSETRLMPFDQGKKDESLVNASLAVVGTYVDGRAVDSIAKQRGSKGVVEFDLKLASLITFRYGAFRRRRYVSVYCDDVGVGVSTNSTSGKMVGSPKRCKTY